MAQKVCFFFSIVLFTLFSHIYGEESSPPEKKVSILVGVPIRQKPLILKRFLESLDSLQKTTYTLDYYFIDDNDNPESSAVLKAFSPKNKGHIVLHNTGQSDTGSYICNEITHDWTNNVIWKVASLKNSIIQYARIKGYDFLFFIDSDIVLHPKTLEQLLLAKKDIISNIFWTKWYPGAPELPQVWLLDQYTLFNHDIQEVVPEQEQIQRTNAFLSMLRVPGVYPVGGLGACTLISKKAIQSPISFSRIPNLSFWGEDRHFCVRAQALGFDLFVDTHLPAYHIYRESYLASVQEYIDACISNGSSLPQETKELPKQ